MGDKDQMDLTALSFGVRLAASVANILRRAKMQGLVRNVRARSALHLFKKLHEQVIHSSRELGDGMKKWDICEKETTRLARDVCNASAELMSSLLELKPEFLHSCFKVLQQPATNGAICKAEVVTWIRSVPSDARPIEPNPYIVEENSVWSALLGCNDGNYNWERQYKCFACNDLLRYDGFRNSRKNWSEYYRSVLVFPVQYLSYSDSGRPKKNLIGFLAFDSPQKNAFYNVPDIFDYKDNSEKRAKYNNLLSESTAFQVGAVISDTLGVFLRGAYEQNAESNN